MTTSNIRRLIVDRIENNTVLLTDEKENLYKMTVDILGFSPADGDILHVEFSEDGKILSAQRDTEATAERRSAMREKLHRLLQQSE